MDFTAKELKTLTTNTSAIVKNLKETLAAGLRQTEDGSAIIMTESKKYGFVKVRGWWYVIEPCSFAEDYWFSTPTGVDDIVSLLWERLQCGTGYKIKRLSDDDLKQFNKLIQDDRDTFEDDASIYGRKDNTDMGEFERD